MYKTISVRLPEKTKDQVLDFAKDEKLEQTSEAARKLLMLGLEQWRIKRALELFSSGKVTLSKAAQLAEISIWEFMQVAKQDERPWIKDTDFLEQDLRL